MTDINKIKEEFEDRLDTYIYDHIDISEVRESLIDFFQESLEKAIQEAREEGIRETLKLIDEYPRIEITYKDGSKTKALLEHSLKQVKQISLEKEKK